MASLPFTVVLLWFVTVTSAKLVTIRDDATPFDALNIIKPIDEVSDSDSTPSIIFDKAGLEMIATEVDTLFSDTPNFHRLRRNLQSASLDACTDLAVEVGEATFAFGTTLVPCSCADLGNGLTRIRCNSVCQYCNDSDCGVTLRDMIFGPEGQVVATSHVFAPLPLDDTYVIVQRGSCDGETCGNCLAAVKPDADSNIVICDSCTLQTCSDGQQQPLIDCKNVYGSTTSAMDTCPGQESSIPSNTILEYLQTDLPRDIIIDADDGLSMGQLGDPYEVCYLGNFTYGLPAESNPTASPTPKPNVCILSVAVDKCDALLEELPAFISENTNNTNVTLPPPEGCDCYNFCDNDVSSFSGCCPFGETCSQSCTRIGSQPLVVSGCRDDSDYSQAPEATCSFQYDGVSQTINEQDPFPQDISVCGSAGEYPCFCATITESNGIRCPYCPILDVNQDVVCIPGDGKVNVAIEVQPDVFLSCNCTYLGNNQIDPRCSYIDAPTPTPTSSPVELPIGPTSMPVASPVDSSICPIRWNTTECDDLLTPLLQSGEADTECECFTFCGDRYSSCCDPQTDISKCSISCEIYIGEVVVAGCQRSDVSFELGNNETVPSLAPTDMPVIESIEPDDGSCPVRLNTTKCDELLTPLLQSGEADADCECFTFCGDRYSSCCDPETDISKCSISCQLYTGEVVAAGCRRSDSSFQP